MNRVDLALRRTGDDLYDLDVGVTDLTTVTQSSLLIQALTLRILTVRGELGLLGHPRYGSKVHSLVGRTADREDLGLLHRYIRKALASDPRVREVLRVTVTVSPREPGRVEATAVVAPIRGPETSLTVTLDV